MDILLYTATTLLGKPRYRPKVEWYQYSVFGNVFRLFELLFGRAHGIRAEVSAANVGGKTIHYYHSLEYALVAVEEGLYRSFYKLLISPLRLFDELSRIKVLVPQTAVRGGFPMPSSPWLLAIAYQASSANSGTNGGSGTTLTVSINAGSGSDRGLVGGVWSNNNNSVTATYNSVSMTQAVTLKYSSTNETIWGFVLSAPTTGTNDLVFTGSGTPEFFGAGSVYTGCHQTTASLANATASAESSGTSINLSVTATTDNCWAVAFCGGQRNGTASTGVTNRSGDGTQGAIGDSNATIPNGSGYSMTYTISAALRQLMVGIAIAPSPSFQPRPPAAVGNPLMF